MNNVEMTYLYKDVLVDYYQNILFTEEQTDNNWVVAIISIFIFLTIKSYNTTSI